MSSVLQVPPRTTNGGTAPVTQPVHQADPLAAKPDIHAPAAVLRGRALGCPRGCGQMLTSLRCTFLSASAARHRVFYAQSPAQESVGTYGLRGEALHALSPDRRRGRHRDPDRRGVMWAVVHQDPGPPQQRQEEQGIGTAMAHPWASPRQPPKSSTHRHDSAICSTFPLWPPLTMLRVCEQAKVFFLSSPPVSDHSRCSGIRWELVVNQSGPQNGDRSTVFKDTLRQKWVFSIKNMVAGLPTNPPPSVRTVEAGQRARQYWEADNLFAGAVWRPGQPVNWTCADTAEPRLPGLTELYTPQIYNVDAVAYELRVVGLFSVLQCKPMDDQRCPFSNTSKAHELNSVFAGYSRDGFHFGRPAAPRKPLFGMATSGTTAGGNAWDAADVQSVGGGMAVVGDRLFFYAGGCDAEMRIKSTGLFTLRRDGFASLDAGTSAAAGASSHVATDRRCATTRPLVWPANRTFLFVNFAGTGLQVEVSEHGRPHATATSSVLGTVDFTRGRIWWKGSVHVSTPAVLRFCWDSGSLYSFWWSGSACGGEQGARRRGRSGARQHQWQWWRNGHPRRVLAAPVTDLCGDERGSVYLHILKLMRHLCGVVTSRHGSVASLCRLHTKYLRALAF